MRAFNLSMVAISSLLGRLQLPLDLGPSADAAPGVPSGPFCPGRPASEQEQRQIFDIFIDRFLFKKDITALNDHVPDDYIQHNPFAKQGRQGAIDFLTPIWAMDVNFTVINQIVSDGIALIHHKADVALQDQPSVIADMFRFDGTCIVEHWDVIQDRPSNATNPQAMY